ncbi:MAG: hypothetical protein WCY19_00310 [Candidatus Gastranaerophilaceae bacterium]
MINNLENEKIILEIKDLIKGIDTVKEEINVYCDLIKQLFLSESSNN